MQLVVVPIVALACMACAIYAGAAGRTHRARWPDWLSETRGLQLLAVALAALAFLALGARTQATWREFREAEAQMERFARDARALDSALRDAKADGVAAQMLLFRYAGAVEGELYGHPGGNMLHKQESLADIRAALGLAVAQVAARGGAAVLTAARLETVMRSEAALVWSARPQGILICRPIIVGWTMIGLGLFALVSPLSARTVFGLGAVTALMTLMTLGVFFLEELSSPFSGLLKVPVAGLQDALHAIAE